MAVTTDVVAFTIRPDAGLCALLVKRRNPPHQGRWAFPGGFVELTEDLDRAAVRELAEETGVRVPRTRLRQLAAYGAPRRDPRGRTVTVAFTTLLAEPREPTAADDAADAAWVPVADLIGSRRLAFDHATILADAHARLLEEMERTLVATEFLPAEFTMAELRAVYETVWERSLDPGNFQRKLTPVLCDTGRRQQSGRGRPATLFTLGDTRELWPPLSRHRDT